MVPSLIHYVSFNGVIHTFEMLPCLVTFLTYVESRKESLTINSVILFFHILIKRSVIFRLHQGVLVNIGVANQLSRWSLIIFLLREFLVVLNRNFRNLGWCDWWLVERNILVLFPEIRCFNFPFIFN